MIWIPSASNLGSNSRVITEQLQLIHCFCITLLNSWQSSLYVPCAAGIYESLDGMAIYADFSQTLGSVLCRTCHHGYLLGCNSYSVSIFTTGTVSLTKHSQMVATGSVLPIGSQAGALNANFMNTAYGVAWLDQKLPAYSTADFILRPYAPVNSDPSALSTETWTSSTIAYGTKLTCEPANMSSNNVMSRTRLIMGLAVSRRDFLFQI